MSLLPCDGCGRLAGLDHLSQRFRRLGLATQFRPIHIGVLFLSDAPPESIEDYFYLASSAEKPKSRAAQAFFSSVMAGAGISREQETEERLILDEFQRRGFYFAEAVECPGGTSGLADDEFAREFGPTLVKRIQLSYKPRNIVLLSPRTRCLIPTLEAAGLGGRLLLHHDRPLDWPSPGDSASTIRFIVQLGNLVAYDQPAMRG